MCPSLLKEALLYVGFLSDAKAAIAISIEVAKATSTEASHTVRVLWIFGA